MQSFKNVEEFYSDNSARRRSPEADYGVHWKLEGWPNSWRVSYVRDTGEISTGTNTDRHPSNRGNHHRQRPRGGTGPAARPLPHRRGSRALRCLLPRSGKAPGRLAREMRSAKRTGLGDRETGRVRPQHYPHPWTHRRRRTSRVEPPQYVEIPEIPERTNPQRARQEKEKPTA